MSKHERGETVYLGVDDLFREYLALAQEARKLKSGCANKPEFNTFSCCEHHRSLNERLNEMRNRGKDLLPDFFTDDKRKDGFVLSRNWWRELKERSGVNIDIDANADLFR